MNKKYKVQYFGSETGEEMWLTSYISSDFAEAFDIYKGLSKSYEGKVRLISITTEILMDN